MDILEMTGDQSMTRNILVAVTAMLCLAAAPIAGAQRSAGENIDDATLAVTVKTALIDSDDVDAGDINIEAYKATIQLSGFVSSADEKSTALSIAANADGVAKVDDAIIVMTGGKRSMGRTLDDEKIHAEVKLKIANVSGIGDAIGVVAHVRNGEVLLSGFVGSDEVRKNIVAAASAIDGVSKVHDRIAIGA
jgi:hyperosmotically inducible protein